MSDDADFQTANDAAGLKLRASAALAQPPVDPALQAFEDALDDLIEFTGEDAISACTAIPGGHGIRGPDVTTADRLRAKVLDLARRAFQPTTAATPARPAAVDNGLLTTHNPNRRLS